MSKGLEALDKLEECAYAMKDLPMSNWIDLVENEAELDLKIMNWTEEIKFELFKGKQALDRLEKLENLLKKYEIEDLAELEIALDYYYHRYDNVQTRKVKDNEKINN